MSREYVALPKDMLEEELLKAVGGMRESPDKILDNSDVVPVAGIICQDCGQSYCNEYSDGSHCRAPFCDGTMVRIGTRDVERPEGL